MSMLSFLFKDKSNHSQPVEEISARTSATAASAPRAASPTGSKSQGEVLDFDEIRCALDQIAEVLGRGEGYEMLKTTSGDVTAIELRLADLMEVAPSAFSETELSPADEDRKVTVLIEDIFSQLSRGRIATTVHNLVADTPAEYHPADLQSIKDNEVSLPLPLVVGSINPEELQKRTTRVERASGIADLPNLFSSPAMAEEPVPEAPETVAVEDPQVEEITAENAAEPSVEEVVAEEPVPEVEDVVAEEAVLEVEDVVAEEAVPEVENIVAEEPEEVVHKAASEPATQNDLEEAIAAVSESDEPLFKPAMATPPEDVVEPEPVMTSTAGEPELMVPERPVRPAAQTLHAVVVEEPDVRQEPDESSSDHGLTLRGLDLNKATAQDLITRLDGVGPRLAKRIVQDRDANGPFLDLLDLARVPGLGRKTFTKITGMRWPEGEEALPEMRKNILTFSDGGFLSVKDVARRFGDLPGFDGCIVAHQDGYVIATSWDHKAKEALGAFAPQIFKRVAKYVRRLDMGKMDCMTVILDQSPITFVPSEEIYFVAIHKVGGISRKHVRLAYGVGCRLGRLLKRRSLAA